jgi:hypothetical protein
MVKVPILANRLMTNLLMIILVVTPGNSDADDADLNDLSQDAEGDVTLRLSFVESSILSILRKTQDLHIFGSQMMPV